MTRRIVWMNVALAVLLVAVGIGGYLWIFKPAAPEATGGRTLAVQTGSLSQTVTATGTVSTAGIVKVSFVSSAKVESVKVKPGATVKAGRLLVTSEDSAARQGLASADSAYVQAVTAAGRTGLTITAAHGAVRDAERAATLNKVGYAKAVTNATQALTDARATWSPACLDPNGTCPDTDAWAQLRAAEGEVAAATTAYTQAVQTATSGETTQNIAVKQAASAIKDAQDQATSDCAAYGAASPTCTAAQRAITTAQQQYESAANGQKVAQIASQQSLVTADQRITSANVALRRLQSTLATTAARTQKQAQQTLDDAVLAQKKGLANDREAIRRARESLAAVQAAAVPVDTSAGTMTADQAAIDTARAGVQQARAALEATVLRSPVSGKVAAVANQSGDTVAGGTTVVTVVPDAPFQVVASFSEADALKLVVGQKAAVTLNALGDAPAIGTVTQIDALPVSAAAGSAGATTGTGSASVTSYHATVTLDDAPDGVRQGMSATVVVTIEEVADVLWLPTSAVSSTADGSTVTVRRDGVDTIVPVTTGLVGDGGIEVTSGLSVGDEVVIPESSSGGGPADQFGGDLGSDFGGGFGGGY